MSLVVDIGINADRIRRYSAQRIGDKAHGWNDYIVFLHPPKPIPVQRIGIVWHKYEDGANVLAFKVLHLITEDEERGASNPLPLGWGRIAPTKSYERKP